MELEEAFRQYLVHMKINEGRSYHTVRSYEEDLKQYLAYLRKNEIHDTKEITYDLIQNFIMEESKVKASNSVVRMAASIRSFHRDVSFLTNENDPALNLEVHKNAKTLPVYCTVDEITRLMASFDDKDPKQYTNHAILELIYACGLRVSEAVSLTLNRVDLDTGMLRVLGKGDKERIVPIPHGSILFLKNYRDVIRPIFLKKNLPYFFINAYGRKVTVRSVELLLEEKTNELNFKKHITPHKLRHSYATHMLQGGADLRTIQEILGHANIATTEIYTHIQNRQMFDSYEKFHPGEELSSLNIPEKMKKE